MNEIVNEILEYSTAKAEYVAVVENVSIFLRTTDTDNDIVVKTMIGNESIVANIQSGITKLYHTVVNAIDWAFNKLMELIYKLINLIAKMVNKGFTLLDRLKRIKDGKLEYDIKDLKKMPAIYAFADKVMGRPVNNDVLKAITIIYKDFMGTNGLLIMNKAIREALNKDFKQAENGKLSEDFSKTELGKLVEETFIEFPAFKLNGNFYTVVGLFGDKVYYSYYNPDIKVPVVRPIIAANVDADYIYEDIEPISENDLDSYIKILDKVNPNDVAKRMTDVKIAVNNIRKELKTIIPKLAELAEEDKTVKRYLTYIKQYLVDYYSAINSTYIVTLEGYFFGKAAPYYYHAYKKGKGE